MNIRLLFSVDVRVMRLFIPKTEHDFLISLILMFPVSCSRHDYLNIHASIGVKDFSYVLHQFSDALFDLSSSHNKA